MKTYALITGGTSGIGFAFAEALAKKGYNLIITGRREELLRQKAAYLENEYRIEAKYYRVEFAQEDEVRNFLEGIKSIGTIEVLINNAGYSLYKEFNADEFENQAKLMMVHNNTPVRITKALLPQMLERKKGFIINVCSLGAIIPLKNDVIYCGTKAFLLQFTRTLHLEVRKKGVYVQALVPGMVETDLFARVGQDINQTKEKVKVQWMQPREVAEYSLACIRKRKVVCIPGFMNRVYAAVFRYLPERWLFAMLAGAEKK